MHQIFHCFDSDCVSLPLCMSILRKVILFGHDCLILIQHMQQLRTIFAGLRQVF